MTFTDSFNGKVQALNRTKTLEGFQTVTGAGRIKPASRWFKRTDRLLVKADQSYEKVFHDHPLPSMDLS